LPRGYERRRSPAETFLSSWIPDASPTSLTYFLIIATGAVPPRPPGPPQKPAQDAWGRLLGLAPEWFTRQGSRGPECSAPPWTTCFSSGVSRTAESGHRKISLTLPFQPPRSVLGAGEAVPNLAQFRRTAPPPPPSRNFFPIDPGTWPNRDGIAGTGELPSRSRRARRRRPRHGRDSLAAQPSKIACSPPGTPRRPPANAFSLSAAIFMHGFPDEKYDVTAAPSMRFEAHRRRPPRVLLQKRMAGIPAPAHRGARLVPPCSIPPFGDHIW